MASSRKALTIAGVLLLVAVALAIVGLVIRVLRWLLVAAAVVAVMAAAIHWLSDRRNGD